MGTGEGLKKREGKIVPEGINTDGGFKIPHFVRKDSKRKQIG